MAKIQGPKQGKTYSDIYKKERTQPWPVGSEIYLEVHENPKAFWCVIIFSCFLTIFVTILITD